MSKESVLAARRLMKSTYSDSLFNVQHTPIFVGPRFQPMDYKVLKSKLTGSTPVGK